jgi:hypothetical protein
LDRLRSEETVDALVVNTQSMGLALGGLPPELPVFVALDAKPSGSSPIRRGLHRTRPRAGSSR